MLDIGRGGAESLPRQVHIAKMPPPNTAPCGVPTFRAGSEAREKQNHDIWGGFNSGRTAATSHVPGRNATPKHHGQDEEKPRFSRAFSLFYLFIPFTLFFIFSLYFRLERVL